MNRILNPGGRTIKKKNVLQIFDGYLGTVWKTGGGGGGGVWLSQNKIYLISPHPSRLCSLLMMIPPHWKTISYSPPFMLCQRRLIPAPFPVKTMQPSPRPPPKVRFMRYWQDLACLPRSTTKRLFGFNN